MDLGTYAAAKQWAVRRWVSPVGGRIEIRGHAGKVMPWGENWGGSVEFLVVADGNRIYEAEADDGGQEYSVSVTVEVGTTVDFLIGPGSAIGVSRFTATLTDQQNGRPGCPGRPSFVLPSSIEQLIRASSPSAPRPPG